MARTEDLVKQFQEELDKETPKAETTAETKPEETTPEETEAKEVTEETKETEPENPEPEKPTEEPKAAEEKPEGKKREIPDDQLSRATYSFRRQLSKEKEKHERELKERDEKLAALEKKIEEMTAGINKAPEKTRLDFKTDEEYMDYLTEKKARAMFAERDKDEADRRAKEAEEAAKKKAEEEENEREHEAWMENVNAAFGGDTKRQQEFIAKVQYANKNGLGEILDNCPVASDYVLHNPKGPLVLEKLINDKETLLRVFGQKGASALDIYYELRNVERELSAQPAPAPAPAAATPSNRMPHLGRPGKQAGSGAQPDIFADRDAMRSFIRSMR